MTTHDYIVYCFWLLLPSIQLLLVIYNSLELLSGRKVKALLHDDLRQLGFLALCITFSFLIDIFFINYIWDLINYPLLLIGVEFPLIVMRIMTFPMVLFLLAKIIGGTKPILIPINPKLLHNRTPKEK